MTSKPVTRPMVSAPNGTEVLENEYDVSIEFENVRSYPILVKIPMRNSNMYTGIFCISRKDHGHILLNRTKNPDDHEIILYPKDRYVKKIRISLRGERGRGGVNYDSYFQYRPRSVVLWGHKLSTRPDLRFDINIQYECEYYRFRRNDTGKETNSPESADKKMSVLSNIVSLTYSPSKKEVMKKKNKQMQAWRYMMSKYEREKRMIEEAGGGVYMEMVF